MPVHPTKHSGMQWGKHGKVYFGRNAYLRALRQGRAIVISERRQKKKLF